MLIFANTTMAATSEYDFQGFTAQGLTTPQIATTFNFTTGSCQLQMSSTNTFTASSSFDSTISWRSPDDNIIGTSTLTGILNTSCLSYGQTSLKSISNNATTNYYESSITVTETADSGFVNTRSRYVCQSPNEFTLFTVSNVTDSRGFCVYPNRFATGTNAAAWITELSSLYQRCGDLTPWDSETSCIGSSLGVPTRTFQFIYPFNSSSGSLVFDITAPDVRATTQAGEFVFYNITILDVVSGTSTIIGSFSDSTGGAANTQVLETASISGSQSLTPNRQHLLIFSFENEGGVPGAGFDQVQPPIALLNISTFIGDFVCGEFGECINGSQSRVCVDQLEVLPDRIETRSCFDVPSDTIDLGFEAILDLIPRFIYTCQLDWTIVSCLPILETINARYPVNWTIFADSDSTGTFRQNYIRISDDTSTVGTRSLQMNYIPPKLAEPVSDPGNASLTVCGNKTVGDFPFVTTGLNQSLFVSRNISFPSPFIQIRLDARKCAEPILQYDYSGGFFSICDIAGVFRKVCYASNCSEEPKGNYRVGLFDAQTLEQIVEFSDVAINSWTSHIIDLSNAGLLINHNYTIIIVVNPETETGIFDPNSHCVYFDNFRVTITETALPECITRCEGLNLLLANQNGNLCFFTEITNSPACAPDQSTAESFQSFQSVCIDTTLHFFNNNTGLWDQTSNSNLCIEQEAAISDAENVTSPLDSTTDYIEFFDFIFSPIFIYIIFAMVVSGILSGGIARVTKNGDGVFNVFGVSMIIFFLLGSLPGIAVIPIWISIAVIAVISLLIAQKLRSFGFPGGGG